MEIESILRGSQGPRREHGWKGVPRIDALHAQGEEAQAWEQLDLFAT